MKSKITKGIATLSILSLVISCEKDKETTDNTTKHSITGYVQKGPFVNGSSITVYDLKSDLSSTGKSFNTQISDNKGTFELDNIELSSNYASLKADGFYYNEVQGKQSTSQITLYALSDLTDKSSINVNILTTLEKPRVEYLIKSGKSFADSKKQAEQEILSIFNIEKSDIADFENLDLSKAGTDNSILLSLTSIIQGYRTEAELTELMAGISNDIKTDGKLDSASFGSALLSHAKNLDTTAIKTNLTKQYSDLGSSASIPAFGSYLANFISKTTFVANQSLITYAENGINGKNILDLSTTSYLSGMNNMVSLSASIPKGLTLKIKITATSKDSSIQSATDTTSASVTYTKPYWYYSMGTGINWSITVFDSEIHTQTFTMIESDKTCDLAMFFDKGTFLIEYFESSSTTPTRSKTITVK